ncbi:spore germination protein [Brevibacillus choshinensis]|uniref:Spore germination protein n=1 Tax=Brevibacillus choshinensis TaxID=54911 RepID=A0ABX7FX48_BRECH|nr:spore germination protein [Brevibacillus choshinensis]QRG70381.1 spore germination protein [Brevibacillus choshinensis]
MKKIAWNRKGFKTNRGSDPITPSIDEQIEWLRQQLTDRFDVVYHQFVIGSSQRCALVYLQGMVDIQMLQEELLRPLFTLSQTSSREFRERIFERRQLPVSDYHITSLRAGFHSLLDGSVLFLVDGEENIIQLPFGSQEQRTIDEPANEATVRGPREAFIENAEVNLSLIRKRLKTPLFKTESMRLGTHTQTEVMILYIQGICKKELVDEVKMKLANIEIDGVLGSSYLEEFLDHSPFSPFPQVQYTERPDVVSAALLEGRVAMIIDGTPMVLLAPVTLWMLLQSAEDYYQRYIAGTWIRWIRYLFVFISLLLPSVYVAITTFHPEMIPPKLLMTIAASREIVPFPALIEAFIMEVSFEALREAAVRIPKSIGQAVSIIGALIIGTAAVQAGIVSAAMVIIVSFTGIASFIIPHYDLGLSFRFLRFPIMIFAGLFGLFGIICGLLLIYIHLINLRSFGTPYLAPMTPFIPGELKDTYVRAPWWSMRKRPSTAGMNKIRQRNNMSTREEDGD